MNTEQNYVGRDSHANSAQNSGQPSPSAAPEQPFTNEAPQDWCLELLDTLRKELDVLIVNFISECTSTEHLAVLSELFEIWLAKQHRKTKKGHGRHITFNTLRIINFIVGLQDKKERIIDLEQRANRRLAEKEVSNG